MEDMPRKLPLNVTMERNRHGTVVFYYRVGKGPRTRIHGTPNTPEFDAQYKAVVAGKPVAKVRDKSDTKTLKWLIDRYMETAAWKGLSTATRKQRGNLFKQAVTKSGNADFRDVSTQDIRDAIDGRADTPAQANCYLKALRGLYEWALRNAHVEMDPTHGVDSLSYKTDGFAAWDASDVRLFCHKWDIGTRPRLALELLLCSGLRRSDVVVAGRQHMSGNIFTIKTQKTGAEISVEFSDRLIDVINATETGELHFLVSAYGTPFTVESFGNWFRDCCRDAGVEKSAHGVRKFAATMAANGGASSQQIMAQFGWSNVRQAETYTKKADRKKLGVTASRMVAEQMEKELSPPPNLGAGDIPKKTIKSNRE
jgi:integrase